MEILIDGVESSQYYDEVLYVASNYSKFVKNPRKKAGSLKRYALFLTGIAFVFLVIFAFLNHSNPENTLYFYVMLLFLVTFALGIVYYILINHRISKFRNSNFAKRLGIEKDFIEFYVADDYYRMEMSDIQYILINRYSICFLPREKSNVIAINVRYKNQVLEAIGESGLIVDNSELY
jgi:hypothetical protein